jgi:hypothetical protein
MGLESQLEQVRKLEGLATTDKCIPIPVVCSSCMFAPLSSVDTLACHIKLLLWHALS